MHYIDLGFSPDHACSFVILWEEFSWNLIFLPNCISLGNKPHRCTNSHGTGFKRESRNGVAKRTDVNCTWHSQGHINGSVEQALMNFLNLECQQKWYASPSSTSRRQLTAHLYESLEQQRFSCDQASRFIQVIWWPRSMETSQCSSAKDTSRSKWAWESALPSQIYWELILWDLIWDLYLHF